jgi:nicotinamidase/pyrazinamidase
MSNIELFWDVDTQHDFIDAHGRLPVPGAEGIVPNLRRLTEFAVTHHVPIVASADAHPPDDPEFEEFGPHCVAGTPGQRKVDATSVPGAETLDPDRAAEQLRRLLAGETPQLVIEKTELDVFAVPETTDVLRRIGPEGILVYGVTTEYCVLRAVEGMIERGYSPTVVADAVKAIGEQAGRDALAKMREAGAEMTATEDVLEMLSGEMED